MFAGLRHSIAVVEMPEYAYTLKVPGVPPANSPAGPPVEIPVSLFTLSTTPTTCAGITQPIYQDVKGILNTNITNLRTLSANLSLSSVNTASNIDEALSTTQRKGAGIPTTYTNAKALSDIRFFLEDSAVPSPHDTTFIGNGLASQKLVYNLTKDCKTSGDILEQTFQSEKDNTETSKLRLESIQSPEEKVGYYESWFPLNRPLNDISLFVLFGFSIFFLLLSVTMFLRMGGVEFNFLAQPTGGFALMLAQLGFMMETYRTPILYGLISGAILGSVGMWLYNKYA